MIQSRNKSRKRNKRDATTLDERYLERLGELEETTGSGEGRHFGTMPDTWMVVQTDPRGQDATLAHLSLGGDTNIEPSHIIEALGEHYNIQEGIDEEAIRSLLERALDRPDSILNSNQVIARAKTAIPGDDGRIDWEGKLNEKRLNESFEIHEALKLHSLEDAMKCNARGFLVFPEQVLAHISETEGESGLIFSEEPYTGRPCLLNLVKTAMKTVNSLLGSLVTRYRRGRIYRSSLWISEDSMRGLLPHEIIYQNRPH